MYSKKYYQVRIQFVQAHRKDRVPSLLTSLSITVDMHFLNVNSEFFQSERKVSTTLNTLNVSQKILMTVFTLITEFTIPVL